MGLILEEIEIGEITAAHVDGLLGREETQRLEFKETIEKIPVYELAKDFAAMGNADGGYFVVGAVQDKSSERCTGFKSVLNTDLTFKRIQDIAAEHIQDRLALEPVLRTATTGERLILVSVPKAPRIHAVTYDGRTEYWKRVGRNKVQMKPHEIEAAYRRSEILGPRARNERKPNIAIECRGYALFTTPENPNSATLAVELYVTNRGAPTSLHEWELRYHFSDRLPFGVGSQPLRTHADFRQYRNIARMETPIEQLRTGALIADIYHENIGRGETIAEFFVFCSEVLTGRIHRVDSLKGSPSLVHPNYQ